MPIGNTGNTIGPKQLAAQSGADTAAGTANDGKEVAVGNAAANPGQAAAKPILTPEDQARLAGEILDQVLDNLENTGKLEVNAAQIKALADDDPVLEDILFLVFHMLAELAATMNDSLKTQLDSSQAIRNKLIEINDLNKELQKWQPAASASTTTTGKLGGDSLDEANRLLALMHKYGVATDVPDGAQNDPNLRFGPDSNRDFPGEKYNGWISQLGAVRDNVQTQTQQLQLTLQNIIGISTKLIEASSSTQGKNFQLTDTISRNFLQ